MSATVWPMDEGGIVVKTDSVDEARVAYWAWLVEEGELPPEAQQRADRAPVRGPRWYRWVPCSPRSCYDGGNHRPGHLEPASGPARGAWRGVEVNT
jgi:hypothetical protein